MQEVFKLARRAADERFHDHVDTGHLMLGVLMLGQGVGLCAMTRLGVNFRDLQRDIEEAFPVGQRFEHWESIPYTPAVKQLVLESSSWESKALGHSYIGTEHLFLGVVRSRQGAVFKALQRQSVALDAAREAVRLCLSGAPDPESGVPNFV